MEIEMEAYRRTSNSAHRYIFHVYLYILNFFCMRKELEFSSYNVGDVNLIRLIF
jgi:hypothetical protein